MLTAFRAAAVAALLALAAILFLSVPAHARIAEVPTRYDHQIVSRDVDRVTLETHRVRPNESLSSIAIDFDVPGGWTRLAFVNRDKVGPDWDLIERGIVLAIPSTPGRRVTPLAVLVSTKVGTSFHSSNKVASSVGSSGVWSRLADCESGDIDVPGSADWGANTGNGFYGGLQFTLGSWHGVGGAGYPHQASAGTQIAMAQRLQASQGWGAWPHCASLLGL